jgi:hypothetical protein
MGVDPKMFKVRQKGPTPTFIERRGAPPSLESIQKVK